MSRQVALLRAINLGARNRVPMAELRALVEGLGFTDVETYVQSGNVVFGGRTASAAELAEEIERGFGFAVPVVLRTHADLAALVAADPLGEVADDDKRRQVLFCGEAVGPDRFADLDPHGFPPEAFHVAEREVVVWSPEGVRSSPALRRVEKALQGLTVTARNWRTVRTLAELSA